MKRYLILPDGSGVDPDRVIGWRDAGPDAAEIMLDTGAILSVYVSSSVVRKLLEEWT